MSTIYTETNPESPTIPEQVGEGVGGLGGTIMGAAVGSMAGPLGAILGGLAGAFGGWWAGEKVASAIEEAIELDELYRTDYSERPLGDFTYEELHPAYVVGHAAANNPDWKDLSWEDIDAQLNNRWAYAPLRWEQARPYAHKAFVQRRYEDTLASE